MPVLVFGLSHHTAPVQVRERFAFAERQLPEALARLRASGWAEEAVILSTCNRVELYVATARPPAETFAGLHRFLLDSHGQAESVQQLCYGLTEPDSLVHLFRVASGLDSMVLGETEILGQLKRAYALALEHRHTGPVLNRAFQCAFHVAKQVRSTTNIQRGSVSVGSVAVELAEKIFARLTDRDVMVIGAGDTSEKTARALLSRGARSIVVANRSYDRAQALARELGGRAIRFDDWEQFFEQIDIVISSTAAPHYILDRPKLERIMKRRRYRPLLLIDIAVPRDIDPAVAQMDNVYLYNIDNLQSIADAYLSQRQQEIQRCEAIIAAKVQALLARPNPPCAGAGPTAILPGVAGPLAQPSS
jgi:glutamyl-tRNA reductase